MVALELILEEAADIAILTRADFENGDFDVEHSPFLDDDDNIIDEAIYATSTEDTEDSEGAEDTEVNEAKPETTKPKAKRTRKKTTTTKSVKSKAVKEEAVVESETLYIYG